MKDHAAHVLITLEYQEDMVNGPPYSWKATRCSLNDLNSSG